MKKREAKNRDISQYKLIKIISTNIKKYRLEKDISQETLAEYANLHRNSISLLEKGGLNFTMTTLEDIANALEVDVSSLIDDSSVQV